jgi:hypothetical protein
MPEFGLQYELLPDANAAFGNRDDIPFRQTQYGQLLDIYYVVIAERLEFSVLPIATTSN